MVFDDGHILRPVEAAQAGEIVVEDDIENPVQPVLNAPMSAHGGGECFGVERCRGQVISPLLGERAVALAPGFDQADHGQMGKRGSSA